MPSALSSGQSLRLPLCKPSEPSLPIPAFIYGTAWKKAETEESVIQAFRSGFSAVDTAAPPRHYQEHLVGAGLRRYLQQGTAARRDVYVRLSI